jgi:hypothetical protein
MWIILCGYALSSFRGKKDEPVSKAFGRVHRPSSGSSKTQFYSLNLSVRLLASCDVGKFSSVGAKFRRSAIRTNLQVCGNKTRYDGLPIFCSGREIEIRLTRLTYSLGLAELQGYPTTRPAKVPSCAAVIRSVQPRLLGR